MTAEVANGRRGEEGRGCNGFEVVSRESPVVIVVIKWRLAGGLVRPLFAFEEGWKGGFGKEESRVEGAAREEEGGRSRRAEGRSEEGSTGVRERGIERRERGVESEDSCSR